MDIIIMFLKLTAILLAVNFLFVLVTNTREKTIDNIVKLPKTYLIIFTIGYFIFHLPIIAYIGTNDYSRPEMILIFSIMIIMCLIMIISCINWKIEFEDEVFRYRTTIRHTILFKYSDITKIKRLKSGSVLLKANNRWLIIDQYAVGKEEFLLMVSRVIK